MAFWMKIGPFFYPAGAPISILHQKSKPFIHSFFTCINHAPSYEHSFCIWCLMSIKWCCYACIRGCHIWTFCFFITITINWWCMSISWYHMRIQVWHVSIQRCPHLCPLIRTYPMMSCGCLVMSYDHSVISYRHINSIMSFEHSMLRRDFD